MTARPPTPLRLPRTPLQRWLANDPGLLRAKQAVKTIASCALTFWLFQDAPSPAPAAAFFAAFVFMQSNAGNNRHEQMGTMLMAGVALTAVACLGGALQQHPWVCLPLSAALAATAYHLRGVSPRYAFFPMFCFALFTVITGHPDRDDLEAIVILGSATGTALCVSFLIYFYILPENRHLALLASLRQTYVHVANLLGHAATAVASPDERASRLERFMPELRRMIAANRLGRSLLDRSLIEDHARDAAYGRLLDKTADLIKSLRIFVYAIDNVSAERAGAATPVGRRMVETLTALAEECPRLPPGPRQDRPPDTCRVREGAAALRDAVLCEARTHPTADTIVLMNAAFALEQAADVLGHLAAIRHLIDRYEPEAPGPAAATPEPAA